MAKITCAECGHANDDIEHWCGGCGAFLARTGQTLDTPGVYEGAVAPGPEPTAPGGGLGIDVELGANAIRCPVCGIANEPTRYYCRQGGHELRIYREPEAEDPGEGSWWSRLVAKVRGTDVRSAKGGARNARSKLRGLSRYTRNFRMGMAGGLVALLVVGIAPGPRRYVTRAVKDLTLPDRHTFVDVETVDPIEGQFAVLEWDPTFISDLSITRAWAGIWPGGGLPGAPDDGSCVQITSDFGGPADPGIVVGFVEASDIDRIRVWAGTWADDPAREQRSRPRLIELRDTASSPPRCHYAELRDTADEQELEVNNIEDVESIELRVVDVWQGNDPENPRVALSEVWFERSR